MRSAPPGGGVAEPSVVGEADDHAVVAEEAVLAAHQAVAALADGRVLMKLVYIMSRKRPRRALDDDLAQRGGVEEAHPFGPPAPRG
jgi:hypothetical protein